MTNLCPRERLELDLESLREVLKYCHEEPRKSQTIIQIDNIEKALYGSKAVFTKYVRDNRELLRGLQ